jgi:aminopeptidase-like protein
MYRCVEALYPLCRSITGDGVRDTLRILSRVLPIEMHEVPSGTRVFDWTVPLEWNVRDAWIKGVGGEKVVDFHRSNLHVMGYSTPINARLSLAELKPHLHSAPTHPDWIPFRTSFYDPQWGFCLSDRQLGALPEGDYDVYVDATLTPGHLTYGECVLAGETSDEVLISCHVCHPSLCNDNLSGMVVAAHLGRALAEWERRYTYRFLFVPGTIGSITWLALNEAAAANIKHGLVLTCVGDAGAPTYKRSRHGDAEIDRVVCDVLRDRALDDRIRAFVPWGYDERQYNSPGFDLPVGCLMRTPHGEFPQYHTSADDLSLVRPDALADSLALCEEIVARLEANRRDTARRSRPRDTARETASTANPVYVSRNPKCEPQLGRRGLFGPVGGERRAGDDLALLWVLNLADGQHTLGEVVERSGLSTNVVRDAAARLVESGLVVERHARGTAS